jgi:hypothetical protein
MRWSRPAVAENPFGVGQTPWILVGMVRHPVSRVFVA